MIQCMNMLPYDLIAMVLTLLNVVLMIEQVHLTRKACNPINLCVLCLLMLMQIWCACKASWIDIADPISRALQSSTW